MRKSELISVAGIWLRAPKQLLITVNYIPESKMEVLSPTVSRVKQFDKIVNKTQQNKDDWSFLKPAL